MFGITDTWEESAPDLSMSAVPIEAPLDSSVVITFYTVTVEEGRAFAGDEVNVFYTEGGIERSVDTTVAAVERYNNNRDKILLFSDIVSLDN